MLCDVYTHVLLLRTWERLSSSTEALKTVDHHAGRAELESAAESRHEYRFSVVPLLEVYPCAARIRFRHWVDARSRGDLLDSMSVEICHQNEAPIDPSFEPGQSQPN